MTPHELATALWHRPDGAPQAKGEKYIARTVPQALLLASRAEPGRQAAPGAALLSPLRSTQERAMGIHLNLDILPSRIAPDDWAAAYEEALVLLEAWPGGLLRLGRLSVCGTEVPAYQLRAGGRRRGRATLGGRG